MLKKGLTLQEIIQAVSGRVLQYGADSFNNIVTDSRKITEKELFVPLKGESFNGHDFIAMALEKGAGGTLVQKGEKVELLPGKTYIEVDNNLKAYQDIATFVRRKLNPFTVAITGSSGKTSTKEITGAFLKKYLRILKSEANYNNEVGVPQTLLQLTEEHEACIVEMGMRGRRQIEELALIAEPDAGLITNAGSAHIELLGSREEIARAKWELAEYLEKNNRPLIIPAFDEYLNRLAGSYPSEKLLRVNFEKDDKSVLYAEKMWIEREKQFFTFIDQTESIPKSRTVCLSLPGKHQVGNALLALALAKVLNVAYEDFIDLGFENLSGRNELITILSAKIINDAYNANPESMKSAIETFMAIPHSHYKYLVLGEMKELGDFREQAHYDIGKFCSGLDIEKLLVVGENARGIKEGFDAFSGDPSRALYCPTNKDASDFLSNYLNADILVLLKGSRGAKLEEIIEHLNNCQV